MNDIEFILVDEFQKEFEKLKKKFLTLDEDLETLKTALRTYPTGIPNKIFPISDLGLTKGKAFKVKKFRCKYLKGKGSNSGIRITYGFKNNKPNVIYFIEIYFKADDANEDKERIKQYIDE